MNFKFLFSSLSTLFIDELNSFYRIFVSLSYSLRCFVVLYTRYYNVIVKIFKPSIFEALILMTFFKRIRLNLHVCFFVFVIYVSTYL